MAQRREGCREIGKCSMNTYPESYITKYTSIRRSNFVASSDAGMARLVCGPSRDGPASGENTSPPERGSGLVGNKLISVQTSAAVAVSFAACSSASMLFFFDSTCPT